MTTETTDTRNETQQATRTPGPWRVAPKSSYAGDDINIDAETRGYVALAGKADDPQAQANARLIAAAPELLEALEECVATLQAQVDIHARYGKAVKCCALVRANAAIARATAR